MDRLLAQVPGVRDSQGKPRDLQHEDEPRLNRRSFLKTSTYAATAAGVFGLPRILRAAPQAESELASLFEASAATPKVGLLTARGVLKCGPQEHCAPAPPN